MVDVRYKEIPIAINGSDLAVHTIEATDSFKHKILIISGVRTDDDVMRGEETKLIGCTLKMLLIKAISIFFRHSSKTCRSKKGKAIAFKTFITGELFELLSKEASWPFLLKKVKIYSTQITCDPLRKV
jgi:2-dehydro-3-deoxygalactonokinase